MEIHEMIKALREQRGLSQETLAEKVGYKDRSSIAKVEAGLVDLAQSKIAAFADALCVTPAHLMGWNETESKPTPLPSNILPLPNTYTVPLIGSIACGKPILCVEEAEETVEVPEGVHADFALKCKGDSMINARIFDGDIVYIRAQQEVENGDIATVRVDDEATLKRVYLHGDRLILRAANPMYDDLVYTGAELEQIEVLGLAVAFLSRIK